MNPASRTAGVIIAGGRSRRMGRDKVLLSRGGVPLVQRAADALSGVVDELLLALRPLQDEPEVVSRLPSTIVRDPAPNLGPLGGLIAALNTSRAAFYLAVAADMPLLQPPLLAHLLQTARTAGTQAVVPMAGGEPEPLCAVYRQDCIDAAREQAATGALSLRDLLARLEVSFVPEEELRRLDPDLRSFLNVNREGDLETARRLLGEVGAAG